MNVLCLVYYGRGFAYKHVRCREIITAELDTNLEAKLDDMRLREASIINSENEK